MTEKNNQITITYLLVNEEDGVSVTRAPVESSIHQFTGREHLGIIHTEISCFVEAMLDNLINGANIEGICGAAKSMLHPLVDGAIAEGLRDFKKSQEEAEAKQ